MASAVPSAVDDFDWEGDVRCQHKEEDLIVYEMHVRGYTKDPSSGVAAPGTYAGVRAAPSLPTLPHRDRPSSFGLCDFDVHIFPNAAPSMGGATRSMSPTKRPSVRAAPSTAPLTAAVESLGRCRSGWSTSPTWASRPWS
jgi:hypothetical protein